MDIAFAHASGNDLTVLLGGSAPTSSRFSTTSQTVRFGTSVPVVVQVQDSVGAYNTPTGKVTFLDGTTVLGTSSQTTNPYSFTVSGLAAGSHTLSATYSGDARSLPSTSDTITIQVNPASQTITFGPLKSVIIGAAPFTISATASSGLPVTFASTTTAVCTVAGTTVTIVAPGTCSIAASQAGNANYLAAPSVTQSFAVSQANAASQTITFGPLSNVNFGVAPFTISATASSGLPVSFTSTTFAVCTVSGSTVTIAGTGTCSITASQGGNASFLAAPSVQQSFASSRVPSGTLIPAPGSPFALSNPVTSAVGDFNGDGKPDLAVVNQSGNNVSVLLGNGAGGFSAAPGSPFAVGTSPNSIAVADLNGDGKTDIVVSGSTGLTLLLGNGLGGFTAGGSPGDPFRANSVAAGDFNGDGIPDIVETVGIDARAEFGVVTVLLGNGSGGFTTGNPFHAFLVGLGAVSAVGDFNRDGNLDVIVNTSPPGGSALLLGNGTGGFTVSLNIPFVAGPINAVAAADFNGDGILDLATASTTGIQVLLGDGSGGFNQAPGSPITLLPFTGPGAESLAAGDFNGDGIQDLAVQFGLGGNFTVLLGNGSGGFTQPPGGLIAKGVGGSFAVADFNGDGRPDLAALNPTNVTVLLGALAPTTSVLTTTSPATIASGANVPLSLAVSDTGPAFNAPTGTATFSDGGKVLGNATQTASPYSFTVSGLAAGTHTLTATYNGDTRSLSSTSNTITIQVTGNSQTITFGPLKNVTLGVAPFTISATASSGLPVSFASTTSAVCTVAGNIVTVIGTGTCSITASQPGNATYAAAPPVTQSFTVTSAVAPGPTSDNFNEKTLNTSLWTFVNPVGDGSYSLNGTHLLLVVPGGSNHDPAFGGVDNTARVLQPVGSADFAVQARFDSIPDTQYQFQGIVVEQDAANFLRFQVGSTGSALVVNASTILGGIETVRTGGPVSVNGKPSSLWLRVRKSGDTWTQAWSQDGSHWQVVGSFKQALTLADIGPFAGNYNDLPSVAPTFTAAVNYFRTIP